jgi:hypothetical protein
MNPLRVFARAMLGHWSAYLTGGILLAIYFIWDSFFAPVPIWAKVLIAVIGTVVAAYYAWEEQFDRANTLRERLIPRLEIVSVPVVDVTRYRIRVNNLSGSTIHFAAELEFTDPQIDHALPVPLQITNHAEPQGVIPAHSFALIEVFVDYYYGRMDVGSNQMYPPQIGLLLSGHPPVEVYVQRQRYTIRIRAYPVEPNHGLAAIRQFYIIPRFQEPCIFGDAGVHYQEPV